MLKLATGFLTQEDRKCLTGLILLTMNTWLPKSLFHSTTVSWVLLILQCLMIVWHTKVGDGWQLQECSILWKMENHCINGWSKRMNIVYCNIFHGLEWFSGLEFLVIELEFWQLQSWLLASHLLVFSIAYGLVQFMSRLENAGDTHFRIKPRFLQLKQDLLLLQYSMVSWNYVEEPEKHRVLKTCSCNCSWQN
jgi:hypothetical protein